jgi:hypothetical protein
MKKQLSEGRNEGLKGGQNKGEMTREIWATIKRFA